LAVAKNPAEALLTLCLLYVLMFHAGYCCPAGQTCQRNNQYFWICKAAVPQ
jgi:hypothetical protein